jgi:hypothetical protein
MLYRGIIAVCSEIHTKHVITLCGQKVEFMSVDSGGTYSDHWVSKGYIHIYVQHKNKNIRVL